MYLCISLNDPGNLYSICFEKNLKRPSLKLRNSIKTQLYGIFAAQFDGLPLPLPILEPITFFVTGI